MPISRDERQLLALLSAGLGNEALDKEFLVNVDWHRITSIAKSQTVLGIILDGLTSQNIVKPDRFTLIECIGLQRAIEVENARQNIAVADIVSKYKAAGLDPILLKGQSVAIYYDNPSHRQPGDIDLYFPDGYERANALAESWTSALKHEETIYHKSYTVKGIELENHKEYVLFYSKRNEERWGYVRNDLLKVCTECLLLRSKNGEESLIKTFNPQMNAIYLYLHLQHHLLQTGIGLRQICDWACLWKKREQDIDKDLFLQIVDILPVKRCMTALTWIVVNYLGLDEGIIPLNIKTDIARKDGELLLRDILDSGNFGRSSGIMDGFVRNSHWNNLRNYTKALKRMIRLRHLCPSEVDAYIKYWILEKLNIKPMKE